MSQESMIEKYLELIREGKLPKPEPTHKPKMRGAHKRLIQRMKTNH